MYINLSLAQKAAIQQLIAKHATQPTYSEYCRAGKVLAAIPAPKPTRRVKIPHTLPGVDGGEPWTAPLFKPNGLSKADIPEGLALMPIWDSGNNHVLQNAATAAWTCIWNAWGNPGVRQRVLGK